MVLRFELVSYLTKNFDKVVIFPNPYRNPGILGSNYGISFRFQGFESLIIEIQLDFILSQSRLKRIFK